MRTTIWVSPDIDQWRVQEEGSFRAVALFSDQLLAIETARKLATLRAPATVKVQDYSGRVLQAITVDAEFDRAAA